MQSSKFSTRKLTDKELWDSMRLIVLDAARKNPNLREEDINRATDGLFNTVRAFENKN